jgi:hypothetical protein
MPPLQPGHGGLLPHWHAPDVEQLSAVAGSHTLHALPELPQVGKVGEAVQPLAVQHPPAHEVPSHLHCPVTQRSPVCVQSTQAAPDPPHALLTLV